MEYRKEIVDVIAKFDKTKGYPIPEVIIWEDGSQTELDKPPMKPVTRASLRVGGQGLRYTVQFSGREWYLYYEQPTIWFLEVPN